MTARKLASQLDANSKKIINLPAPSAGSNDAARQVDLEAVQAYAISRANHTGQQTASTISNFVATVQGVPINTLAVPTGALNFNGQLITNVGAPVSNGDAATKSYVDNAISGLASGQTLKGAVRALVKTNVTISSPGNSLDGVTPATGEVYWLGAQTTASENGPWVWNGSGVAMTRPTNFSSTVANTYVGAYWIVTGGTSADTLLLLTNDAYTLGTTAATYKVIDVAQAAAVPVEQDLGNGSATAFTITHNFGTRNVEVLVYRNASPWDEVEVFVGRPSVNTVSVEPDEVWSSNAFHAVVRKVA